MCQTWKGEGWPVKMKISLKAKERLHTQSSVTWRRQLGLTANLCSLLMLEVISCDGATRILPRKYSLLSQDAAADGDISHGSQVHLVGRGSKLLSGLLYASMSFYDFHCTLYTVTFQHCTINSHDNTHQDLILTNQRNKCLA